MFREASAGATMLIWPAARISCAAARCRRFRAGILQPFDALLPRAPPISSGICLRHGYSLECRLRHALGTDWPARLRKSGTGRSTEVVSFGSTEAIAFIHDALSRHRGIGRPGRATRRGAMPRRRGHRSVDAHGAREGLPVAVDAAYSCGGAKRRGARSRTRGGSASTTSPRH